MLSGQASSCADEDSTPWPAPIWHMASALARVIASTGIKQNMPGAELEVLALSR